MMKYLWLYPLVFALLTAALLACMLQAGWLLHEMQSAAFEGAQLVWEAAAHALV